jgi:hypothetical protein
VRSDLIAQRVASRLVGRALAFLRSRRMPTCSQSARYASPGPKPAPAMPSGRSYGARHERPSACLASPSCGPRWGNECAQQRQRPDTEIVGARFPSLPLVGLRPRWLLHLLLVGRRRCRSHFRPAREETPRIAVYPRHTPVRAYSGLSPAHAGQDFTRSMNFAKPASCWATNFLVISSLSSNVFSSNFVGAWPTKISGVPNEKALRKIIA